MADGKGIGAAALVIAASKSGGGGGGTTNYNNLSNKPQINGVELTGNKTAEDLGIDAPVQSVNTKTGAVVLSASDILATNAQSIQGNLERIDERIDDVYTQDEVDELLEDYIVKDDAPGYDDILTSTDAATTYETKSNVLAIDTRLTAAEGDIDDLSQDIVDLESDKQDALNQTQLNAVNSGITSGDVARMLKTPLAAPTDKILIGVDEDNNEVQYYLGDNLEVEGTTSPYVINATGGGGEPDAYIKSASVSDNTLTLTDQDDTDITFTPDSGSEVSGTNDGTNWTSITIDNDTYAIPQGGGSSYTFTNGLTENGGVVSWDFNNKIATTGNYYIKIGEDPSITTSASSGLIIDTGSSKSSRISLKAGTTSSYKTGKSSIAIGSGAVGAISSGSSTDYAIVIGNNAQVSGNESIAIGRGSKAGAGQITIGKWNAWDETKYLIIGKGTSDTNRSNLLTLDISGNLQCNNIPAQPSNDGNYVLKCSIIDGVATYSWVAE